MNDWNDAERRVERAAELYEQRKLQEAVDELRAAIARWPDRSLDRYQLPHPLLGKLTLREMLIFTAYHQMHHLEGVKRRRGE